MRRGALAGFRRRKNDFKGRNRERSKQHGLELTSEIGIGERVGDWVIKET